MNKDLGNVLITEGQLANRAQEIAEMIDTKFKNEHVVLVGILKGSYVFTADIARRIKNPNIEVEFIIVNSYLNGKSTDKINVVLDLKKSIKNKNVIIIEDIIDTGRTLSHIQQDFIKRGAKQVEIASMCSKPSNRKVEVNIDYPCFVIPDEIVVGYGLDFNEKYRHLPYLTYITKEGFENYKIKKTH